MFFFKRGYFAMLVSTTSGVELERPLVFYFSFKAMLKSMYMGHFATFTEIAHLCII